MKPLNSDRTLRVAMARKPRSEAEKRADAELGKRLAQLRKDRGFTQIELAEKVDSAQTVITDYERGRLRPHHLMLVRIAQALEVSTDELLGLKPPKKNTTGLNRRFLRRLQAVDQLPQRDQEALLRTIDAFIRGRKAS